MPPSSKPAVKLVRKRLDAADVVAHFDRIEQEGRAVEVRVKAAAAGHSHEVSDLREATGRLVDGELIAVQVRFYQAEAWWCDTVVQARDGYRLVRMHQG